MANPNSTFDNAIPSSNSSIPPPPTSIPPPIPPVTPLIPSMHNPNFSNPPSYSPPPSINGTPSSMVFLNLPVHTKLSRTNFLAWRSQIEPVLHAYGLINFISAPPLSSTSIDTVTGQVILNPDYLAWYKQDQMILAWLRASLSEPILAQVVSSTTSLDLWRTLTQTFSASSRARLTELKKKLQSIAKGGNSCTDFIQQIRALSDELAFIGYLVPDQDLVMAVLGGLTSEYNAFIVAVNSRQEPISFLEVQSLLLSHEMLLQTQNPPAPTLPASSNPTAFYANSQHGNVRSSNSNRNFRSYKARGGFNRSAAPSVRPRVPNSQPLLPTPVSSATGTSGSADAGNQAKYETCQICFKRGHTTRGCWWRCDMRYSDDFDQVPSRSNPPGPPPQAHVAQARSTSLPTNEWYLDSGATHHVTSDINNLSSFEPYTGGDKLQIGDGNGMQILNTGSSVLSFGNFSINLNGVLHVPLFTKNLISLSKVLADNNLTIEFYSCFCIIKDRHTSTTILHARVINGLYRFTISPSSVPQAFLGEKVAADIWHYRFGHPSLDTTRKILIASNLPCTNSTLNVCCDCNVAKCHKLPFNNSSTVSMAPLELIHSDVWGPAPLVTSNGFRYFVIFVDDFTRFSWIFFLHSKDEVVKVFASFKLQVENLVGNNIKILRTDGGTEFKPITRLFPQIVHQTTCPYTPEQNGVAERKHRHIIELSLAVINHASIPLRFWDEIFASVVYLINRMPPSLLSIDCAPYQRLFNKPPNYLELKVLGSQCFPLTKQYNVHKLQPHSVECVFIGYAMSQKGYRCLQPSTGRIFVSRHAIFNEQVFPFKSANNTIPQSPTPPQFDLWLPTCHTVHSSPTNSLTLGLQRSVSNSTSHESPSGPHTSHSPSSGPSLGPNNALFPISLDAAQHSQRSNNSTDSDRASNSPPDRQMISSSLPDTSFADDSIAPPPQNSTHPGHAMVTRSKDNTRHPRHFPDFVAFLASAPISMDSSNRPNYTLVVLIYVDDIIVTGSSSSTISSLIHTLQARFALKDLGSLGYFLGIAVKKDHDGLHLSQQQYITDLLCRTHMIKAQPVPTPMAVNTSLSKYDGDPFHDPKLYRAVVGALQYVTITRPDITFPVNKCSQFMHNPTTSHWSAVKRILRYLNGTIHLGLSFKPASSPILHAYSDSDWAGCPDDKRSTSAFCIYLGPNLVSWSSKKQPTVSKSSTEAEYRSLALAAAELIWVQLILQELQYQPSQPPVLWCDNIGATFLASNHMFHARTKHVEIDFHFIRERVQSNQLTVKFISSRDQIADGLTKGLTTNSFLDIRNKLMITSGPSTCGGDIRL
ncbi:hypothetical protein LUZ63_007391 [Rhynchospora breviuscula]|uniref:Integrase catalytic domain-containing protein n=1 Tax=Rhynchospora breviuscula TaxID=2022672 RepID=A0A9Q0HUC0_9POAL|nr:hypothetical protein LUZ63_007391 [Rhynchospora breviuscula]